MLTAESFGNWSHGAMEIDDERRDRFLSLLREASERKNKPIYKQADEAGVTNEVLRTMLRVGQYVGLKAADLLKVVRYYHLDIGLVAELLGTPLPNHQAQDSRVNALTSVFEDLDPDEQEWLLGAIDVLLRGMRR